MVWPWRLMEEGDVNLTVGRLALEAKRNVEASSAASREPKTLYFGKFKGPPLCCCLE